MAQLRDVLSVSDKKGWSLFSNRYVGYQLCQLVLSD